MERAMTPAAIEEFAPHEQELSTERTGLSGLHLVQHDREGQTLLQVPPWSLEKPPDWPLDA